MSRPRIGRGLVAAAIGLVLLTSLWLVVILTAADQRSRALADATTDMSNLAETLAMDSARTLDAVDVALRVIGAELGSRWPEILADSKSVGQRLRRETAGLPYARSVLVLDHHGKVVVDSAEAADPGRTLAHHTFFKVHGNAGPEDAQLFLGLPMAEPDGRDWLLASSRPIHGPDGALLGVVAAILDPRHFTVNHGDLDLGDTGQVTVWRPEGGVIVDVPFDHERMGQSLAHTPLGQAVAHAPRGILVSQGDSRLIAYERADRWPLAVAVSQDIDELLTDWRRGSLYLLALSAALSVVLAVMILVLVRQLRRADGAARALGRSEARQRAVLDAVAEAIVTIDARGRIVGFNPAAEQTFGLALDQALGRPVTDLMPAGLAAAHDAALRARPADAPARAVSGDQPLIARHRDGHEFPIELTVADADSQGERLHIGVIRDITDRLALEAELRRLADTDPLTGLHNRRRFMEELTAALASGPAVVVADLDLFKQVNDRHGHPAGDAALVHFAALAGARLRDGDILARLGGEEFALILPATSLDDAAARAEALRADLAASPVGYEDQTIPLTASFGVAARRRGEDGDHLLRRADQALYRAKEAGRNKVVAAD